MNRFKTAGFTALTHLVRLFVMLFILKQIALVYGPEGLGFLGNYMSLMTIAASLAGGGVVSGVIKYVSQFKGRIFRQLNFVGSAFVYSMSVALLTFISGFLLIKPLTDFVFLNSNGKAFIGFFLLAQIIIAFNNFFLAVVNGFQRTDLYAYFMITGHILALLIAWFFIKDGYLWGAIIAVTGPAVLPVVPIFLYGGRQFFTRFLLRSQADIKTNPRPPKRRYPILHLIKRFIKYPSLVADSRLLSGFSLMLLVSAICFPVVEIIIRNMLIDYAGLGAAGFWQAITRLSAAYMSFYSLFLMFYFVPLISAANDRQTIIKEVKKNLLFVIILFSLMMFCFSLLRYQVVEFVFSKEFTQMTSLFVLQMAGDFFRCIGWVIGFVVVARAMTKWYVLSEIAQGMLFIGLSSVELAYAAQVKSIVLAYVATCVVYCFVSLVAFYYWVSIKPVKLNQIEG